MTTKTMPMDKRQAQSMLNKFHSWLQEIHNQTHPIQASELEHHFTHNFQLTSNGQELSHNLQEYSQRIEKLKKKYSKFKITPSNDEPLINENKIATHYTLSLTPRAGGQTTNVDIMAFATLEGEKISKWHQVAHEKGQGQWDK